MNLRLSSLRRSLSAQLSVLCVLFPGLVTMPIPLRGNPSGGVVVNGAIEIGDGLGGMLSISQSSQKGIINWDDFSIGAGEVTQFLQPSADSSTLNRVVSGNPSAIHGALQANGKIFVINPNGIMVGPGGSIDVAGLVMSTLDVSDAEYLAGGDMVFRGNSGAGVQNFGRINAIGGDVFLIGKTVENAGSIGATGTVGLAAGEEVLITAAPDANGERVFVKPVGSGGAGTGITNTGSIEGAAVELKAHGNLYALAINNSGSIRATGASRSGGGVFLRAPGGQVDNTGSIAASMPSGDGGRILIEGAIVNAGGSIDASATTEQGQGGEVTLLGESINVTGEIAADGGVGGSVLIGGQGTQSVVVGNGAQVSANGSTGAAGTVIVQGAEVAIQEATISVDGLTAGGEVNVGGGFQGADESITNAVNTVIGDTATISANALGNGDAGQVVIWADGQTEYTGTITAEAKGVGNGGFVEISGAEGLLVDGFVSTLSAGGKNGTLLLDPKDFTIAAGGAASTVNSIGDSTLEGLLGSNSVVISTFDPGTADAGNITVLGAVRWNTANSLTLLAEHDIYVAQDIINQSSGNVNLVAGWDSANLPLTTLLGGAPGSPGATSGDVDMDLQIFDTEFFGVGDGSVYVGTSDAGITGSDTGVVVGSRLGQTNVAGHDVNVWAGAVTGGVNTGERKFSQIGYNRRDGGTANTLPVESRIRVQAKNNVDLDGNHFAVGSPDYTGWTNYDRTGLASFAMIGHGGERDSARDMTLTGEIIVEAGNDITADGGITRESYAQIGHGGYDNVDDTPGVVVGGEITVNAGGDVIFNGGNGQQSHARIGHGGNTIFLADYTKSDIDVDAGGDIIFRGNDGTIASNGNVGYAQIGHGGYNSELAIVSAVERGDIHVDAGGKIEFVGGERSNDFAMLGHGGSFTEADYVGDIFVNAGTGGVEVRGGGGLYSFGMIGHGGYNVVGDFTGDIVVTTTEGGVLVEGGSTTGAFANIGSGGYQVADGSSFSGATSVTANGASETDGIELKGGSGDYTHAVIGHGVARSSGGSSHPTVNLSGDVTVETEAGGILLQASQTGYFSHAGIGHGGRDSSGTKSGEISVTAHDGDIEVLGGETYVSSRYAHAQIGHGGYGNGISGDYTGGITVLAESGEISLVGGETYGNYVMIGHGGFGAGTSPTGNRNGSISVTAEGDILLDAGTQSYTFAQIGHGGRDNDGDHGLDGESIVVISETGNLEISGGSGSNSIALIGSGDNSDAGGTRQGDILVDVAGEISIFRDTNLGWIGHRTRDAGAVSNADVTIRASSLDQATGVSGSGMFQIAGDVDNMSSDNLEGGDVTLVDMGDGGIWVDEEIRGESSNALTLLSYSDVFVSDDLISMSDGDINVVAGWDPSVNDLADLSPATEAAPYRGYWIRGVDMDAAIFDNAGAFGANNGSVYVGVEADLSGTADGVMVGSRYGAANVAGHDVNVWAAPIAGDEPYGHAQIGFNRQDAGVGGAPEPPDAPIDISGSVRVKATNDVSLVSNYYAVGAEGYPGWTDSPTELAGNEGYAAFARIGHGGRDLNRGTLLSGDLTVEAGNDVSLQGGHSRENYAMIGHGGFDNKRETTDVDNAGIGAAKITVDAEGNVSLNGGSGSVAFAQIGHIGATHDLISFVENAISVSAGGDLSLVGGTGAVSSANTSYAMIGHGGSNSDFTALPGGFTGDIDVVVGGDLEMLAGNRNVNFVQIGHGGYHSAGNHGGDIKVTVDGATGITMQSGDASSYSTDYAQIGHGGVNADGDHSGEICVIATAGGISLDALNNASATGGQGYTMIGHGGQNVVGDLEGDLTVVARGASGISLTGGAGTNRFAQIGHGGQLSSGSKTGDLTVVAETGALSLVGGTGTNTYAMVGHGDAAGTSTGQIEGGVHLYAAGAISGTDGTGSGSGVEVFHQTAGGLAAGDYSGGDGFEMIAGGGVALPDSALSDIQTMIDGNLAAGPISLAFSNAIDLTIGAGNDFTVDTSDDFYLMTGGSITMLSSYQNSGDGDVYLVAGWDGTGAFSAGGVSYPELGGGSFNYCEPTLSVGQALLDFNDCDIFGNGNATVTIGDSAQASPVLVGSLGGNTIVGGYGVSLLAGSTDEAATQLGYFATAGGEAATGTIGVGVKAGGLSLTSGTGEGAYTQIGHGGNGSFDENNHDADVTIVFCEPGDLSLLAGEDDAYSQIGHGGFGVLGDFGGNLTIIGHDTDTAVGTLTMAGGENSAYAQIGHGGRDSSGVLDGDIVIAANAIDLDGGNSTAAYSQIGHGGFQSDTSDDGAISGDIILNYDALSGAAVAGTGDITLNGGGGTDRYAQIGHGGLARLNDVDGSIKIGRAANLGITAGGITAYALVGHGGEDAGGEITNGAIDIDVVGAIDLDGGTSGQTFAMIGHGGHDSDGVSVVDSAITINAADGMGTGDITLDAGTGANNFAQIGHGGTDSGIGNPVRDGDISILNAANIRLGQTGTGGTDSYTKIGHGGDVSGGDSTGNIELVSAGDVSLGGGGGSDTFAQIGHGGHNSNGEHTGSIHVAAGGDIVLTAGLGEGAYALIGHGGSDSDDIKSGEICVHADGLISLTGGTSTAERAFAQIGHGGAEDGSSLTGDLSGEMNVVARGAGGISLTGGAGTDGYAHIGHGGTGRDSLMAGDITIVAETGDLLLTGGSGANAYAMFGHGDGAKTSSGQRSGGVHLFAQGNLTGTGGTGAIGDGNVYFFHQNDAGLQPADYLGGDGYQKVVNGIISMPAYSSADESTIINGNIGLGAISIFDNTATDYVINGGDTFVNTSDDLYIVTGGNVTMLNSYQNEGTGGVTLVAGWDGSGTPTPGSVSFNNGDLCEPIISNPGLSIDFNDCDTFGAGGATVTIGSTSQTAPVMVGSAQGTTTVAASGLILHGSDSTSGAFSQLGFVPTATQGDTSGNIDIHLKGGGLLMDSGNVTNAYTQIGHGGYGSTEGGSLAGDISITFCEPGDVTMEAGLSGNGTYALIGHGGNYWEGSRVGAISVAGANDITMTGGNDLYSNVQIGHGGVATVGHHEGAVSVDAAGDILATGGTDTLAYVQIGHGGQNTGVFSGSSIGDSAIDVTAGGDVVFKAGSHNYTSAKIGHGGNRMELDSFGVSPVSVAAGGNVQLISPQFDNYTARSYSHSQIGHGGYGALVGDGTIGYQGDITVEAGGKIDVLASKNAATFNYSTIGHVSYYNTAGVHSGDISVTAGTGAGLAEYGLTIHGGTGDYPGVGGTNTSYYNFASIGHRGHNRATSLTGDIDVEVQRGGIMLTGGTGISGSTSDPTTPDIRLHPAQIGHGGYNITSTGIDGSIRVHAQGDILLQADNGRQSPVQIGHGGYGVDGTFGKAGDIIEVISYEGGLELNTVGADAGNTAFIGNGDSSGGSGARLGDILIDVAEEISLVKGSAPVWIGHRGNVIANYSDADVTIRARALDFATGDSGSDLFNLSGDLATMVYHNLAGGDVSLIDMGGGGIWTTNGITSADSDFDLNLLSASDIFVANDLINRGSGNVNLVAGWDPSVSDLSPDVEAAPFRYYLVRDIDMDSEIFDVDGASGNGGGSVYVGANADLSGADTGVVVASRTGQTNVAGYDVNVWGGAVTGGFNTGHRKYSQIGYNRQDAGTGTTSPANGRIRVKAENDVSVEANHYAVGSPGYDGWTDQDRTGYASFAQIGHGGERTSVRDMDLTGEIIVEAGNDLGVKGGLNINNHAQIGHGGYDNPDDDDGANDASLGGNITVDVGGNISFEGGQGYYAFAQLGHGGGQHFLGEFFESDITVTAGGDVNFTGGPGNTVGNANSNQAYAQLGHGGYNADFIEVPGTGNNSVPVSPGSGRGYTGDIMVTAGGGVSVNGGAGDDYNYAVIGHGGAATNGDHSGDVTVLADGDVSLTGGDTGAAVFASIGHFAYASQGNLSGDTTVTSTNGAVLLQGGDATTSQAQIGHGGYRVGGALSGDVEVFAGGTGGVSVLGGGGAYAYAAIGNGGVWLDGSVSGSTLVTATGTAATDGLIVQGGEGNYSSATVGHLSQGYDGNHSVAALDGAVTVSVAAGGVSVAGGTAGYFSHGMIGHGGRDADGDKSGAIDVTADSGDITLEGGGVFTSTRYTHAQIGHGGYGNNVPGDNSGTVDVEATTGSVSVEAGENYGAYSQIGHGGLSAGSLINGNMSDNVSVVAGNMVTVAGGTDANAYGLIGHGGITLNGTLSGDVSVTAGTGGVSVLGGSGGQAFGQIGCGGYNIDNDISGDVTVTGLGTDAGDGVRVVGGEGDYAVGQIGHGSNFGPGDLSGDITVEVAAGGVSVKSGNEGYFSHGMIGHGGRDNEGDLSGAISVTAESGDITLEGGDASDLYRRYTHAQIGHGGYRGTGQTGTYAGDVTVAATAGNVLLQGGDDWGTYTQIGHGGLSLGAGRLGDISGEIAVSSGGSTGVSLIGGTDENAFALIGHGGHNGNGDMVGGITVTTTGDAGVNLDGGSGLGAFAQIGNGGTAGRGDSTGAILVTSESGNVSLEGGSNTDTQARIGAGGSDVGGNKAGNVTVTTGGLLELIGGVGDGAFSQVGHGGNRTVGFKSGDIAVTAAAISMTSGDTVGTFTQIGHGGLTDRIGVNGSVSAIVTDGDLTLDAGDGDHTFALFGNGGSGIVTAPFTGHVQAIVQNGGVSAMGGGGLGSFAQIGSGGYEVNGSKTGSVLVNASDSIELLAGTGEGSSVMIGMGGFDSPGHTFGGQGEEVQVFSGGNITLQGSDAAEGASAMIGFGGTNSDTVQAIGDVTVLAAGDIELSAGDADWAAAQIGNGGAVADGNKSGGIFVSADNDISLVRGAGENSFAKIGHGDQQFTPVSVPDLAVGGGGFLDGDIQVTAGENVSLTGGMIGHLDPALNNQGIGAGGDTYVAVSRNEPTILETGTLVGDADSVLASDPTGELRLYLPGRASNLLVGSSLNGTAYAGANVDPLNQQIDELVIHQLDEFGVEVSTPAEHSNLDNAGTNLLTRTLTPDTGNYSSVLGNYTLYYDTITVVEAGPPVDPTPTPGGGDAGAGGGASGGAGDAGGVDPEIPIDPEVEVGEPPVFTIIGTDGQPFQVQGSLEEELDFFLTLPDGSVFLVLDRTTDTPLFFPVGDLIEDSLDDFLNDDNLAFFETNRAPWDPWGNGGGPDFQIVFGSESRPGFSSFDLFGPGGVPGIDIVPIGIDNPFRAEEALRKFLEGAQIELEELGFGTASIEESDPETLSAE